MDNKLQPSLHDSVVSKMKKLVKRPDVQVAFGEEHIERDVLSQFASRGRNSLAALLHHISAELENGADIYSHSNFTFTLPNGMCYSAYLGNSHALRDRATIPTVVIISI